MQSNKNILRFVHCDTLFADSKSAIDYVYALDRPVTYAEPMILKYGEETNPNIILAIGSVGNGETSKKSDQVFFIDCAKLEESIEDLQVKVSENADAIQTINHILDDVIASCGLENIDGNVKYIADENDSILKKAKSLANADTLLSQYILKVEEEAKLIAEDTKSIETKISNESGIRTISSRVKLPRKITTEDDEFKNIIIETEDGIFTHVNLSYAKEENQLLFNLNGETKHIQLPEEDYLLKGEYDSENKTLILTMNSGKVVTIDVEKIVDSWVVLGEHSDTPIILVKRAQESKDSQHADKNQVILEADVRISNDKDNILKKTANGRYLYVSGNAENLSYRKPNNTVISVQSAITESFINSKISNKVTNLISRASDGLYVNVQLDYLPTSNELVFKYTNRDGETETKNWTLSSVQIFDDVTYDTVRECLVFRYRDAKGIERTVTVPIRGIIDEWDVDNTNSTVTLRKYKSEGSGTDKLTANVNISTSKNNILENDNHSLFVNGVASNIVYDGTYKTVKDKLDENSNIINDEITRAKDAESILNEKINDVNTSLVAEKERATKEEENIKVALDTISGSVKTEQERAEGEENVLKENINELTRTVDENFDTLSGVTNDLTTAINDVKNNLEVSAGTLSHMIEDSASTLSHAISDAISGITQDVDKKIDEINGSLSSINLSYDKSENVLTFTNSKNEEKNLALNDGYKVKDLSYSEHTLTLVSQNTTDKTEEVFTVDLSSLDNTLVVGEQYDNPIQLTIKDKEITSHLEIDGGNKNLLQVYNGKLYVPNDASNIKLTDTYDVETTINNIKSGMSKTSSLLEDIELGYSEATNTLIFKNGKGEEKNITLNAGSIIDGISYDKSTKVLTITYHTTSSEATQEVTIGVADLFNQIEVKNEETSAVNLSLVPNTDIGNDILSADVKISTSIENGLTKANGGYLFVSNNSADYKYEETTVKLALDKLVGNDNDLYNKIEKVSNSASTNADNITVETNRAKEVETKLENEIKDVLTYAQSVSSTTHDYIDSTLTPKFNIIDNKLDNISQSAQTLSENIGTTKENVEGISGIVHNHIIESTNNIKELSGNVKTNSDNIATLSNDVKSNSDNIATLSGNAKELSDAIKTNSDNIVTLSGNVKTNSENIVTLSNDVKSNSDNIATLSGNVKSNSDNIEVIKDNIKELSGLTTETTNTISLRKNNNVLSANVIKDQSDKNIIEINENGLFAENNVSFDYNTNNNTITFTDGYGNISTYILNQVETIKEIRFDSDSNELIFIYTGDDQTKTVTIPASSFFKGIVGTENGNVKVTTALTTDDNSATAITANIDVVDLYKNSGNVELSKNSDSNTLSANVDVTKLIDNTDTNVTLNVENNKIKAVLDTEKIIGTTEKQTVKLSTNTDGKITANVNIATNIPHNILSTDGDTNSLFVNGTASNIHYEDGTSQGTTVQDAIHKNVQDIADLNSQIEPIVEEIEKIKGLDIDGMKRDIEKNKVDILALSAKTATIDTITSQLTLIQNKLDAIDNRLIAIENKINDSDTGIDAIWNKLSELDKKTTIIDDDDNDYIKFEFNVKEDGNTHVSTLLNVDFNRNEETGTIEPLTPII